VKERERKLAPFVFTASSSSAGGSRGSGMEQMDVTGDAQQSSRASNGANGSVPAAAAMDFAAPASSSDANSRRVLLRRPPLRRAHSANAEQAGGNGSRSSNAASSPVPAPSPRAHVSPSYPVAFSLAVPAAVPAASNSSESRLAALRDLPEAATRVHAIPSSSRVAHDAADGAVLASDTLWRLFTRKTAAECRGRTRFWTQHTNGHLWPDVHPKGTAWTRCTEPLHQKVASALRQQELRARSSLKCRTCENPGLPLLPTSHCEMCFLWPGPQRSSADKPKYRANGHVSAITVCIARTAA
jgi:hypothetical protein